MCKIATFGKDIPGIIRQGGYVLPLNYMYIYMYLNSTNDFFSSRLCSI